MKVFSILVTGIAAASILGCSSPAPSAPSDQPTSTVIPVGIFPSKKTEDAAPGAIEPVSGTPPWRVRRKVANSRRPEFADAWVYTSQASQKLLFSWGVDPATGTRLWENFFKGKEIGFARVGSAKELTNIKTASLLVLPSVVVLSADEKKAIAEWRQRGGSVLSSWETGAFKPNGERESDSFMESVLNVKAVNEPVYTAEEPFLVNHSETPALHELPIGTKVYMERVAKLPPLRLSGSNEAAKQMDWARSFRGKMPNSLITFDERTYPSGRHSRAVALGYAEQSWMRMDPVSFNAINSDLINWLMRTPTVHLANWPHPFTNTVLFAFNVASTQLSEEVAWAKRVESVGGVASFYFPPPTPQSDLTPQRELARRGHEIGWLPPQPPLTSPNNTTATTAPPPFAYKIPSKAEVPSSAIRGCGYRRTEGAATGAQLDHCLLALEADDTRAPVKLTKRLEAEPDIAIGLPVTLALIEDRIKRANPAEGMIQFEEELSEAGAMGALSVIRINVPDTLNADFRQALLTQAQRAGKKPWITSAGNIANWWRERDRVQLKLIDDDATTKLNIDVNGQGFLHQPIAIDITNPSPKGKWLVKKSGPAPSPHILQVDDFITRLVFENLAAGRHVLELQFVD